MPTRRFETAKRVRLSAKRLSWRPLGGLLGPAVKDARQSLVALGIAAVTSLITGLALASFSDTFRENPGLLLLLPAAIGLRGNVFGPLGSRLSTAFRAGTFAWAWRKDSLLGQNIIVALTVSFVASVLIAVVAKTVSTLAFEDGETVIGLDDFIVVSVVGAVAASVLVLVITLGLAVASSKFGWDLDNVTAPIVSASGDFVTLPAILFAVLLVDRGWLTASLAIGFALTGLALAVWVLLSKLESVNSIFKETVPVLMLAATLSLVAGIVLENSKDRFEVFTVLLVLLPGYLAIAGALGGILSNRLATKVHLGLVKASALPQGNARKDIALTFALALPIFAFLAFLGHTFGTIFNESSPGLLKLVLVALTGGLFATSFVAIVAYYAMLVVVRFGLDPDNHGIPVVSASLDLVGASTLIGALLLWGVV